MFSYINFNTILDAGNEKYLNIQDKFPQIPDNQNIGVFFSGGMESTLLALICRELYGIDRIKLIYSDHLFADSQHTKDIILENVKTVSNFLNIPVNYVYTSKDEHIQNAKQNVLNIRKTLIKDFDCYYSLLGFTSLFWDLEELLVKNLSPEEINRELKNNTKKYENLKKEFHYSNNKHIELIKNVNIHVDTYEIMKNYSVYGILLPFDNLNKNHIVNLYKNLNWWEILLKTESCVDDYGHCGNCFACQQRHDAFVIAGEVDPTKYELDYVRKNSNVYRKN